MASTYVNDLRLNEMATGDASGTWGEVTNTNLELIAEAFSFGTEAITTNADTHDTIIADGQSDPGRSMYLKYTGTLDSACTITIAPNTVSKMWFIENGTSGSQNIIISQGSGANITIPAGDVKVIYSDGAGSGAAVVDAFASLSVVDLKVQDDLTVTDDMTVGGTLGVTGVLTATSLDISGDIDVDGTTNLDVVDIDGAVDMASTLQVDGAITSSAGATITTADNTNQLTLVSTDADAAVGPVLDLYRNSGSPADDDFLGKINFRGRNDNSQDVNYGYLSYFIADASDGTEDGFMQLGLIKGGSNTLLMEAGVTETVFNQSSVDQDFRVESNGNANMLFVDGGNDKVSIGGTSTDDFEFHVQGTSGNGDNTRFTYTNADANGCTLSIQKVTSSPADNDIIGILQFDSENDADQAVTYAQIRSLMTDVSDGSEDGILSFHTRGAGSFSEKMRIDSSGSLGIGNTNPSGMSSNANKLVVGTGSGNQGMSIYAGTSTGRYAFARAVGDNTDAYDGGMAYDGSRNLTFHTNANAERMRIDGSGNVGIGNTECSDVLHVTKTGSGAQIALRLANEGTAVGDGPRINFTSGTSSEGSSIKSLGTALNKADLALSSGGNVETMRMTSDNDVVIGHTAAVGTTHKGKLQVKSAISILDGSNTTAATLSLYSSGANSAFLSVDPDQEGNDTHFYFYIDGSNKMKLDNNGRLSIDPSDTRTATGALNLLGEVGASFAAIAFRHNASGVVGTVTTSASATAYNTSSDYRLKENVDYTWDATTRLKQLKPARFNFIADETNTLVDGFIAHEVSSIVPEAITGAKDAVDDEGNPEYQGIDQSKLVPLLVKTIQELEARITTLEG